jgi:GNAT superfamily N-acetyltransferase
MPVPVTRNDILRVAMASEVFFCRDAAGALVGTARLVVDRGYARSKGMLEDVSRLRERRGEGIGDALMSAVFAYAREAGLSHIDLTSHPRRIEANLLYQRLGGVLRDTNIYRFDL